MSILKIRMELDNLLYSNKYHFGICGNSLCIKTECGKSLMSFYDIEISKNITKKELAFTKELILQRIDEINKMLKKYDDILNSKPEEIKFFTFKDKYYVTIDNGSEIIFDLDSNYKEFKLIFEDVKEIDKILKELKIKKEKAIKYIKWIKEKNEILEQFNTCQGV